MEKDKFLEAYERLNTAQKEAVDSIEGPVMVIAGPGTGKTQILTLRIANIIAKTDTEPENVLALTFTEAAAASMRRRLAELIGSAAYSVAIKTFHGFANDAIKEYPENFPRMAGADNVTEAEQARILQSVIRKSKISILKPFNDPFNALYDIKRSISDLKREAWSPVDFASFVEDEEKGFETIEDLYHEKGVHKGKMKGKYQEAQKEIAKRRELSEIYKGYEEALIKEKAYDYDDMIAEFLRVIENDSDFLLMLQEKHQYILVDEHQDTNRSQNRIVELLASYHDDPNIFVVGDEKQAIFRFQGASVENFNHFRSLYSSTKIIALEENYRSTQSILDSAESLISGPKPLKANTEKKPNPIRVMSFSNQENERYFLAYDIKALIDHGTDPKEIAVLYRENREAFPIADALGKTGVPYSIESSENLLEDDDVKAIILSLKAAQNKKDPEAIIAAMHLSHFEIDPFDIYRVLAACEKDRKDIYEFLESDNLVRQEAPNSAEKILQFVTTVKEWARLAKNGYLLRVVESVIRESGLLANIMASDNVVARMERVKAFFNEARSFAERNRGGTVRSFVDHLDLMDEQKIFVKKPASAISKGVRLMTAHISKGLEFEHIYITGAVDGIWGNKRKRSKIYLPKKIYSLVGRDDEEADQIDDERRLFYVAVTRAKESVTISFAKENQEGKEKLPSQFIGEIHTDLVSYGDPAPYEMNDAEKAIFAFKPTEREPRGADLEFVRETFERKGISQSDINNYLECPWKYFYLNLFRIPEAPKKALMYGNAVHAALKEFFDSLKEREPDKEFLLSRFEHHIRKQSLKERELIEAIERGKNSLAGYFDENVERWGNNSLMEFSVQRVDLAPGIFAKGRIDKIEIIGYSGEVNVVDFKTGRVKTRGQIEGSTKDSEGNIKRQLNFYKLLLDGYKEGKYRVVSGEIDFIDPDDRGKWRREVFTITDEEVDGLRAKAIEIGNEIRDFSFWDKRCGEKECPYCKMRDLMPDNK